MVRVKFECMSACPSIRLLTTDPDEAAFLKVFTEQIKLDTQEVYASSHEKKYHVTPVYGKEYDETEYVFTLDILPSEY